MRIEKCPKCGSVNTDMPRAYGAGMRLVYCCRICKDCGHEGARHPTIGAAHNDPEWRVAD